MLQELCGGCRRRVGAGFGDNVVPPAAVPAGRLAPFSYLTPKCSGRCWPRRRGRPAGGGAAPGGGFVGGDAFGAQPAQMAMPELEGDYSPEEREQIIKVMKEQDERMRSLLERQGEVLEQLPNKAFGILLVVH